MTAKVRATEILLRLVQLLCCKVNVSMVNRRNEKNETSKPLGTVGALCLSIASAVLPLYTHRNSPKTYTQPQLVSAVLLGFYLKLSYRA